MILIDNNTISPIIISVFPAYGKDEFSVTDVPPEFSEFVLTPPATVLLLDIATVGTIVGVTIGVVGIIVEVGVCIGLIVDVGLCVGVVVGFCVGLCVGLIVGVLVGLIVGVLVTLCVGFTVGVIVGVDVGFIVSVGIGVAVTVGVGVGVATSLTLLVKAFIVKLLGFVLILFASTTVSIHIFFSKKSP